MKKKIGIIGYGYVGKALEKLWNSFEHYDVVVYDPHLDLGSKEEINKCHLGIIAVPTSMKENKHCDISIVEETIKWLETPVILIKSTIVPGTTDYFKKKYNKRIVFSPEYVGEGKFWSYFKFNLSMIECPFAIFGGDKKDIDYIIDLLATITGPNKNYRHTDPKVAETVKYMENISLGIKVTFANEMKNICDALDVSYWEVRDLWALDPRVSLNHTAVFADNPGFGGKCLPKDINALVQASKDAGYDPKFFEQMLKSNKEYRNET